MTNVVRPVCSASHLNSKICQLEYGKPFRFKFIDENRDKQKCLHCASMSSVSPLDTQPHHFSLFQLSHIIPLYPSIAPILGRRGAKLKLQNSDVLIALRIFENIVSSSRTKCAATTAICSYSISHTRALHFSLWPLEMNQFCLHLEWRFNWTPTSQHSHCYCHRTFSKWQNMLAQGKPVRDISVSNWHTWVWFYSAERFLSHFLSHMPTCQTLGNHSVDHMDMRWNDDGCSQFRQWLNAGRG